MRCIFIGGKGLGYEALNILLKNKIKPLLTIGNMDDNGKHNVWHKSVIHLAKKNKIKCLTKKKLLKNENLVVLKNIDIIFCIGSTQIIPKKILHLPKLGCINIHPSLLPKYRGRYSTLRSILNGDKKTGVTAHFIDEKIDMGKIIMQKKISIPLNFTGKDLYDRFEREGILLFRRIVNMFKKNKKITTYRLRNRKGRNFRYFKKELPNNGEINWNWSGKKIKNFIRAFSFEPFYPPFFYIGKKKMLVVEEKLLKKNFFLKTPK